jgi:hypothetical protein
MTSWDTQRAFERSFEGESLLRECGFQRGHDGLWEDERHEVGATLSEHGMFVGWIDVTWDGPATPVPLLRDVTHMPLPGSYEFADVLKRARRQRQRKLRSCRFCERTLAASSRRPRMSSRRAPSRSRQVARRRRRQGADATVAQT